MPSTTVDLMSSAVAVLSAAHPTLTVLQTPYFDANREDQQTANVLIIATNRERTRTNRAGFDEVQSIGVVYQQLIERLEWPDIDQHLETVESLMDTLQRNSELNSVGQNRYYQLLNLVTAEPYQPDQMSNGLFVSYFQAEYQTEI